MGILFTLINLTYLWSFHYFMLRTSSHPQVLRNSTFVHMYCKDIFNLNTTQPEIVVTSHLMWKSGSERENNLCGMANIMLLKNKKIQIFFLISPISEEWLTIFLRSLVFQTYFLIYIIFSLKGIAPRTQII